MSTSLFELFWLAYPRKVGKKNAEKAWAKLKVNNDLFYKICRALEKQKLSDQWQNTRYVPHPSTWLSQERWRDYDEEAQAAPSGSHPPSSDTEGAPQLDCKRCNNDGRVHVEREEHTWVYRCACDWGDQYNKYPRLPSDSYQTNWTESCKKWIKDNPRKVSNAFFGDFEFLLKRMPEELRHKILKHAGIEK